MRFRRLDGIEWLLVFAGACAMGAGYVAGTRAATAYDRPYDEKVEALPVWYLRACLKQPLEQGCYDIGRQHWSDLPTCRRSAEAIATATPGARLVCAVDREMLRKFGP